MKDDMATHPRPKAPTYVYRPPAWKIAEHWFNQGEFVVDPGEPACFACRWNDHRTPAYPAVSISDAWIRSKLERAHLVPHALGGSDHDVSNFAMLCPPCHRAAPNWRDPEVMLRWVRGRKHYLVAKLEEFGTAWQTLWPDRVLPDPSDVDRAGLAVLICQNAGSHANRLTVATIAAALGQLPQPAASLGL